MKKKRKLKPALKRCLLLCLGLFLLLCVLFLCLKPDHEHICTVNADCTTVRHCDICGKRMDRAHAHHRPGPEPTCTEPQRCRRCGMILAEATGHTPGPEATCTEPQICLVCGDVIAEAKGHTPDPKRGCTEAQVCLVCGETIAEAKGHTPGPEPTCGVPQRCVVCGEILADAKGHQYQRLEDGTERCSVCGELVKRNARSQGQTILPEAVPGDHYHNNVDAYYSGSVLVCGDYAVEYFKLKTEGSASYAEIVNDFARRYPQLRVSCMLVPKACAFCAPAGYDSCLQNQTDFTAATYAMMDDSVIKVDAVGEMAKHAGEYMFYRTDHHWTSLGAYYASVAYCRANGIEPRPLGDYRTVVNTGVIGTFYRYAGEPASLLTNPDYTVIHLPKAEYSMSYVRDGVRRDGEVFNMAADGYAAVFICGDQPLVAIVSNAGTGRKLLIFKESYGNALAPFMIDYFDEVVVMDIREPYAPVAEVIANYGITDVLIMNNVQGAQSLQDHLRSKLGS